MIIFGFRSVTYTANKGSFYCQHCNAQRNYHQKRVRRFFTLYFIPVIPLDMLGEYVECDMCRSTWDLKVLSYDPVAEKKAFEEEFERAVKRVMVLMMLADGNIESSKVERIREVFAQLAGVQLSEAEVLAEADRARAERQSVDQVLQRLAAKLNDNGKELVVKAALVVAASDGKLAGEELQMLTGIARAVGMTSAHFKGVLQRQVA